jgi:WASH complex subunit 7
MHDMETYEQMRTLANFAFGLKLMHVYIPSQTIDQGQVDILNIIRNVPTFVTKYCYHLYSQTFLQITTEAKMSISISI